MKKFLKQFSQILGTTALVIFTSANAPAAQSARDTKVARDPKAKIEESKPAAEEPARPKSIFEDDLSSGKDPFFPKSTRRGIKPSLDTVKAAPLIQLSLKGISGPTNRRFALINNQPLAAGEEAYVRVPGGQVKVHCWEIHEDSAVVSVEGETERKVLRLRDDF